VAAGEPAPAVPLSATVPQPANHLASSWMADHRTAMDQSCAACHQVQTFCANGNCHGRSWPYVNLNAANPPFPLPEPGATPAPTAVPAVLAEDVQRGATLYAQSCASCHPQGGRMELDDLREAVLEGKEGMPSFAYSGAQMADLSAFLAWWQAHPDEPAPAIGAATGTGSFARDVLPVLQARCGASCHSAAAASGGFTAVDYAGIAAAVTPGNPETSRLVQVQQGQHAAKLAAAELDIVIAWIRAGAPNN
jgi:mono/diheme cytochrome c family protein